MLVVPITADNNIVVSAIRRKERMNTSTKKRVYEPEATGWIVDAEMRQGPF
jgi:hypothetical protein